ncbi:MAG TPA: SPFH domain-containing protein [Phycisphaerae bacterium]|nr:SPFH domain-containing protein [Phycisphaerae bacterium]
MSNASRDPRDVQLEGGTSQSATMESPPVIDDFDPAHAELASALRKSFRVLKVLMLVLVVLYFASGFFSVKPDEKGVVLRFGQIVGVGGPAAVRNPGWHWSLPFPIDQWQTVAASEREMELDFMLQLTPEEQASGRLEAKYGNLAPERDDYVLTGDANILHARLVVKYRIEDVIAYVTNVLPAPNPRAGFRDRPYMRYPEYTLLRNICRDAVISTAARFGALDIRGGSQEDFLLAVGKRIADSLDDLETKGASLGIYVDPNTGVIAPKSQTGQLEAIMPPRQTQEVFDQVFSAQTSRGVAITKARSEAESMLVNAAGPDYQQLSDAIEREYEIVRALSAADGRSDESAAGEASTEANLQAARDKVEDLLRLASGRIRGLIKDAEIERDRAINEAAGDYNRYMAVLPEYKRNPEIFLSRLIGEAQARALSDDDIVKVYVPQDAEEYRLHIPRAGGNIKTDDQKRKERAERERKDFGLIPQGRFRNK